MFSLSSRSILPCVPGLQVRLPRCPGAGRDQSVAGPGPPTCLCVTAPVLVCFLGAVATLPSDFLLLFLLTGACECIFT